MAQSPSVYQWNWGESLQVPRNLDLYSIPVIAVTASVMLHSEREV